MGCGSSKSTTAIVAAGAASSDITDAPDKETVNGGPSDLQANGTTLSATSQQTTDSGMGLETNGSAAAAAAIPAQSAEESSQRTNKQANSTNATGGSAEDPSCTAADEAPEALKQDNFAYDARTRLPRMQSTRTTKRQITKEEIEEKHAAVTQRRNDELLKRTDAQKTRQSRRDKLRAEVQAARELEARQAAGDVDELALGLPEESCEDLVRGVDTDDDDEPIATIAAIQFGAGTGLEVINPPGDFGFGDNGLANDEDDEW